MKPREVRRYIDGMGVPCGQDVVLPDDIDTCGCQEFFGTRCPYNVHAKGRRVAHVDRADPRRDPIGHLKKDVGMPYALTMALEGAAFGAAMSKNRVAGAVAGGLAGFVLGVMADNATAGTRSARHPAATTRRPVRKLSHRPRRRLTYR